MGFFSKIKEGLKKTKDSVFGQVHELFKNMRKVDEELLEELEELLSSLAACGNSCYTPSGRPVMTVIPESEIRKRLK